MVRSMLCGPGHKHNMIEQALKVQADLALFDLEDSVPGEQKEIARNKVITALNQQTTHKTCVRVNSIRSINGLRDLLAFANHHQAPDYIMLPKLESAEEVTIAASVLIEQFPHIKFIGIIETVKAFKALDRIIHGNQYLSGLVFGAADFAADMGVDPYEVDFTYVRTELVLAANEINAIAVDCPCFNFTDREVLLKECWAAKRLGYKAKVAIHPNQIATINQVFSPSSQALERAKQVLAHSKDEISTVAGSMIGPPFKKIAEKILHYNS